MLRARAATAATAPCAAGASPEMRDRTPRARETIPAAPPATLSPAEDKLSQLKALAEKIEAHRSSLDGYLDAYARLITPPGVPTVSIRQMVDARGHCLCHSAMFAIAERVAALELEEKQNNGAVSEG